MAANDIDIMGTLNAITKDQILARSEQISYSMPDGTTVMIPDVLKKTAAGVTASEMEAFKKAKPSKDKVFICMMADVENYETGHIYYYDSALKDFTDITPATGGGGGSAVKLSVTFRETEMNANVAFTIPVTWSSSNTGRGRVYLLINGSIYDSKTMSPGTFTFSLDSGLSRGVYTLDVYAVDSANNSSDHWTRTLTVGSLDITSKFTDTATYSILSNIKIEYSHYTNKPDIPMYLIWTLDGVEQDPEEIDADADKHVLTLPKMAAGIHPVTLKIRQTIDGTDAYSGTLSYDIVIAASGVIYLLQTDDAERQIDNRTNPTLYMRLICLNENADFRASLTVHKLQEDGSYLELTDSNNAKSNVSWTPGYTSFALLPFTETGTYKLVVGVTADGMTPASVEYKIDVIKSAKKSIAFVSDDCILNLIPGAKSNDDADRAIWKDSSGNDTQVSLMNFNWASNGWHYTYTDGTGSIDDLVEDSTLKAAANTQNGLVLSGGAYAVIDMDPFSSDILKGNGFTFEIAFKTEDIYDSGAKVLSYYDGDNASGSDDTTAKHGFTIDTENATMYNNQTETTTTVTTSYYYYDKNNNAIGSDGSLATYEDLQKSMKQSEEQGLLANSIALTPYYTSYNSVSPFQTNFPSNTKNVVTFVINRGTKGSDGKYDYGDYQFDSMSIYLNGVLTSVKELNNATTFRFAGTTAMRKIYLGCNSNQGDQGYAVIYGVRAYSRALSMAEVLQNYVAGIKDADEMNDMIDRNELSTDSVTTSLPRLDFYMTQTGFDSVSKENKVVGIVAYTNQSNPARNFSPKFMRLAWQGTSTLAYAVKNYKMKLYNQYNSTGVSNKEKFVDGFDYDLGNGIAEDTFTLKADYMDSGHLRNTGLANFVADLGTPLCPAQEFIPAARTVIYGFPALLYLHIIDQDTFTSFTTNSATGYADSADIDISTLNKGTTSTTLLGVYNFNLDKNDVKSLSLYDKSGMKKAIGKANGGAETPEGIAAIEDFTTKYPHWDCISFEGSANSDTTAGAFASLDDDSVNADFDLRFEEADDLDDDPSIGSAMWSADGKTVAISGINTDINDTYTIDSANNQLVGSKFTLVKSSGSMADDMNGEYSTNYFFRQSDKLTLTFTGLKAAGSSGVAASNENQQLRIDRRYSHIKKLINWVINAPLYEETESNPEYIAENPSYTISTKAGSFKADFKKHFDLDSMLDYFNVVFTVLMADNLGKNVMWNTWGPISTAKAAASSDNYYSYSSQEIRDYDNYIWYANFYDMDTCLGLDNSGNMRFDVDCEIEPGVFNTSRSILWTKFRLAFASEIQARFMMLTKQSNDYRKDCSYLTEESLMSYLYDKQIAVVPEAMYNADFKQKYLMNPTYLFMHHGRQYEFLKRWIPQRLYFLNTKYEIGSEWGKQGTIRVQYKDFATKPVTFHIQTYKPSYVKVIFSAAGDNYVKLKVPRNGTVDFSSMISTSTDQEIKIFDGPNIKNFGDVSPYTPSTLILGDMPNITSLYASTSANPNGALLSVSLANNKRLTELTIDNCASINGGVDLSGCTNLRHVSVKGSTIQYLTFNEDGGALRDVAFSASTTSIDLENFTLLSKITIESLSKLTTFKIINCPLLTGYKNDDGTVVNGFVYPNIFDKWTPTSNSTQITMTGYGKLANYSFLDNCSKLKDEYQCLIDLGGEIWYTGSVIPDRFSYYSSGVAANNDWPDLTIHYDNVTDFSAMFMNYKNINCISSKVKTTTLDDGTVKRNTVYYWTDRREGNSAFEGRYDEDGDRPIDVYDDHDQNLVAEEIKLRLSPFSTMRNMTMMFAEDMYIEKIDPTTFDGKNVSGADTNSMFMDCNRLRYVEMPSVESIGEYAFYNCWNTIIYIPSSVGSFSMTSFNVDSGDGSQHQTVLFEDTFDELSAKLAANGSKAEIEGVADARFGVHKDSDGTGHPLTSEIREFQSIVSNPNAATTGKLFIKNSTYKAAMYYFLIDGQDGAAQKLVYDVVPLNEDGTENDDGSIAIKAKSWNMELDENGDYSYYTNSLGIAEMLHSSMSRFDVNYMNIMTIPSYNVDPDNYLSNPYPVEIGTAYGLYAAKSSIIGLFGRGVSTTGISTVTSINTVYVLPGLLNRLSNYFFDGTSIPNVRLAAEITEIGSYAFNNSQLSDFALPSGSALTKIGMYAFSNTKLENTNFMPDTVTELGESAFANNQKLKTVKYSNAMSYIPIGCFANCCSSKTSTPANLFANFSDKITEIGDNAFDGANFLMFGTTGTDDDHPGYFTGSSIYTTEAKENNMFLECFPNLTRIGDAAFRGIPNITTITINPKIVYIGQKAFIPPESEMTETKSIATKIKWVKGDYSSLTIGDEAFAGRQLDWRSTSEYHYDGLIENAVFIPQDVKYIGDFAFAPISLDTNSSAQLSFVASPIAKDNIPATWSSTRAYGALKEVYDFYSASKYIDDTNTEYLYYLTSGTTREALCMKLIGTPDADGSYVGPVTINVPGSITGPDGNSYTVTEIVDTAFKSMDDNLNTINFTSNSGLRTIGNEVFDSTTLAALQVTTDSTRSIPASVTHIGTGMPLKSTQWYAMMRSSVRDGFIYLNDVCLGYSEGDLTLQQYIDANRDGGKSAMKSSTTTIYDSAFSGSAITSAVMPESLKYIYSYAFSGCSSLESIDFGPCESTLTSIGNSAFRACQALTSMHYAGALTHVGTNATQDCPLITEYSFGTGCKLDSSSYPITPVYDDKLGTNDTIKSIKIPASMGSFFAPGGARGGYDVFTKLIAIDNLELGQTVEVSLPELTYDELTAAEQAKYGSSDSYEGSSSKMYKLDLGSDELFGELGTYSAAVYDSDGSVVYNDDGTAKTETANIVLHSSEPTFAKPLGDYESTLDISNINTTEYFEDSDIVKVIMGYSESKVHTLYCDGSFSSRKNVSKYYKLFGNRVTLRIQSNS